MMDRDPRLQPLLFMLLLGWLVLLARTESLLGAYLRTFAHWMWS